MKHLRYVIIEKAVGETPLVAVERYREKHPQLSASSLAYAGRLDPMASGKLLVLIGNECKQQRAYHALDKEYEFSVLFGVSSDTGDVLGRLMFENEAGGYAAQIGSANLRRITHNLHGPITLPYPHFSSKTVSGKPLHTWTLEGRLDEIEIPTYTATIYKLRLQQLTWRSGAETADEALAKIETIPPVTDEQKALGRDFRRTDVRRDWERFRDAHGADCFAVGTFSCTSSSGFYMRTLAEVIAKRAGTRGLAFSIHRTKIGHYRHFLGIPFWKKP